MSSDKKYNVLFCCTGSVASLKVPHIVKELQALKFDVKVVSTDKALHFFNRSELSAPLYTDEDEWKAWSGRGDPVLHIELRHWADILLLAPLDANTMGKISNGICDNFVTCIVRAWDFKKPCLFAPAMNTCMWEHPVTSEQTARLKDWGFKELPVVEKTLICGDKGLGAMAEVATIIEAVLEERQGLLSNS